MSEIDRANEAIEQEVSGGGRRSAADRAIDYVTGSGAQLLHDQHGDTYIAFRNDNGRREVWPLKSKAASEYIRWCFYQHEQKGLSGEALSTARGTLASMARFEGARVELAVRVAWHQGAVWYDLGDWRAVKIGAPGWEIVSVPPVLFRHYAHQAPQVEPTRGGALDAFLGLLNVRDRASRLLLLVYLVAALLPGFPLPVLIVFGEQGSAKSFLNRLLRALLDPSSLRTLSVPDNLREFVQLAAHHRTVYLDNLSHLAEWLSDALCRLCTGEGFSKRELYTDDDDIVYQLSGLAGLNGVNLVAVKPDLLDRALLLRLEPIEEEQRRPETAVWADFEKIRASMLGAMFTLLSKAMALRPSVALTRAPRLADFAHWGYAIAEAMGGRGREFLEAYGGNVAAQNDAALGESPVALAVIELMRGRTSWEGSSGDLLTALEEQAKELHIDMKAKEWPKAPNALSRRLHEVRPNLRRAGIEIQEPSPKGVRRWVIAVKGGGNIPNIPTIPTQDAAAASSSAGHEGQISPPNHEISQPGDALSQPHDQIPQPGNMAVDWDEPEGGDIEDIFRDATAFDDRDPWDVDEEVDDGHR